LSRKLWITCSSRAVEKDALDVAVAEIGDKATGIPGDVASLNDLDRSYEWVKGYGRKLDVVFANAGVEQFDAVRFRGLATV
jgi:NAD(P)-dependent dehydrogenase (short-subunit alcohol dehydrogenase family)